MNWPLQAIMFNNFDLNQLIVFIVPLLFSVTIHEVAHGYVAYRMGDNTAMLAGRLTLNPVKHLDFTGSFLLPLILFFSGSPFIFGYAKPVPVNFLKLKKNRQAVIFVASAGVLANFGFAFISGAIFQVLIHLKTMWYGTVFTPFLVDLLNMAGYSVVINTVLAVFNLLPIPPLDGSRILAMVLPMNLKVRFEQIGRFGIIIIFLLLITNSLSRVTSFFITPLLDFFLGK